MICPVAEASGSLTGRAAALRWAVKKGLPVVPTLFVAASVFERQCAAISDLPERKVRPNTDRDTEWLFEQALEQEWHMLSAPLVPEIETQLLDAATGLAASSFLIRSAGGEALATNLAHGHFRVLRVVQESWASCLFRQTLGTEDPVLIIAAVPGQQPDLLVVPPEDTAWREPWIGDLEARWGITASLWHRDREGFRLVDAGGPPVDLDDRWGLDWAEKVVQDTKGPLNPTEEDVLGARVLLGRIYNRLMSPPDPFRWVSLLTETSVGTEQEEAFLTACKSVDPTSGERLLGLARGTMELDILGAVEPSVTQIVRVESSRKPAVRQLIGRGGSPGAAIGPVLRLGPSARESGYVFLCDRVRPVDMAIVDGAVAVVERLGSSFGIGAVLARTRGVPHVYGVADASLLPDGVSVTVDGALGLVTVGGVA